jgi:hypothetical protein
LAEGLKKEQKQTCKMIICSFFPICPYSGGNTRWPLGPTSRGK